MTASPDLTVVIPTLNEADTIDSCLAAVGHEAGVQVVVSDGGSRDGTVEAVRGHGHALVVTGPAGRALQLNRGAAATSTELLLFLHADCRLPSGWLPAVRQALGDTSVALCHFRLHTEPTRPTGALGRWWLRLLDLRSGGLRLPYGDQGLGLRRAVFDEVGRFPEIALMEDLELASRCRQLGRVACLPMAMRTTARRFESNPVKSRVAIMAFPILYRLGADPRTLARWYGRGR